MKQANKPIYYLVFTLSIFFFSECYGQITLTGGGKLEISSGTSLQLNTNNGTLNLLDSSTILNNGRIVLNNQSKIFELPGFPITGLGFEISPMDSIYQGWNNPGNLGFNFQSATGLGPLNLYRFHSDTLVTINGFNSINRYYTLDAIYSIPNSDFVFNYDTTELNGLTKSNLKLVEINTSTIEVIPSEDSLNHFSIHSEINNSASYTLTPVSFNINTISDSSFCNSDTITINFSTEGPFNSPNEFLVGLYSDSVSIVLDTFNTSGTYNLITPNGISGYYSIFLNSTDTVVQHIHEDSILINAPPIVSFPNLASTCDNNEVILLNSAVPTGGIYSGVGVTDSLFNPSLTGAGNYLLTYNFTDINGCKNSDTSILVVNLSTPINFNSLSDYCVNDSLVLLNQASPSGGFYSGTSVTGNYFDPSIGQGFYYILYEYSNTFGCLTNDSASITINPNPVEPVISNSNDTLSSTTGTAYQWYFEGTVLTGDINQIFIPSAEGNYQVEIFNSSGCSSLSQPFNFLFNSINFISTTQSFSIYPNPTSQYLNFIYDRKLEGAFFEIFSLDGKLILTFHLNGQPIDVSALENGCYLIRLSNEGIIFNTKFIIEK